MLKSNPEPESPANELLAAVSSGLVFSREPMSRHTSFEIGGPADWLVMPANAAETAATLRIAAAKFLPLTVMGKGSNLLVRDKGIRGLVLKVGEPMSAMRCEGECVVCRSRRRSR